MYIQKKIIIFSVIFVPQFSIGERVALLSAMSWPSKAFQSLQLSQFYTLRVSQHVFLIHLVLLLCFLFKMISFIEQRGFGPKCFTKTWKKNIFIFFSGILPVLVFIWHYFYFVIISTRIFVQRTKVNWQD